MDRATDRKQEAIFTANNAIVFVCVCLCVLGKNFSQLFYFRKPGINFKKVVDSVVLISGLLQKSHNVYFDLVPKIWFVVSAWSS